MLLELARFPFNFCNKSKQIIALLNIYTLTKMSKSYVFNFMFILEETYISEIHLVDKRKGSVQSKTDFTALCKICLNSFYRFTAGKVFLHI